MTGLGDAGGFGANPFEEFLARFFGSTDPRHGVRRVDFTRLMSEQARQMVVAAAQHTAERGRDDLDAEQLLWAATRAESTRELLSRAGTDPDLLASRIDEQTPPGGHQQAAPMLTPAAKRALLDSYQLSRGLGSSYIGPEHLLLALAANPDSGAGRLLSAARITPEALRSAAEGRANNTPPGGTAPSAAGASTTPSQTPTLDQFGQDLTDLARQGRLDPVVGRADEIEQTIEVLSRRTKNNPVLIGEAGVGKTAIVEGLAQRIHDGEVPDSLMGRRVVELSLAGLVAGTRFRGDFEERMRKVVDEIREDERLIIFIDELHTMVGAGAGAEGGMDAGNLLKPALARGELHVIGATTLEEYRRTVEKDAALERRFQPITVSEPGVEDAVTILRGLRDRYEAHHQVRYTDEALEAAVVLSDRYINDRHLPDKAIDLIDQAGARRQLRRSTPPGDVRGLEQQLDQLARDKDEAVAQEQYEKASQLRDRMQSVRTEISEARMPPSGSVTEVSVGDIAEVVARATGIPVNQLTEEERDRLLRLEDRLHERVIGQRDAVSTVAEAIRRSRSGLGDPRRPVASLLFLGPTGVGKTELAKALTDTMYGDEDRMIRLDMSEFQERHTISRLVGAPPGYVGYGEAGELTEPVRRRPYSLVLLDEIEKAHPDLFNLLLQILDDGRLTDSEGRTVDFRNTVLIMTSNLGSDLLGKATTLGFQSGTGDGDADLRQRLTARLRESFRPEFINRIDEIIIFRRLDARELHEVTELLLEDTRNRLNDMDITVEFDEDAVRLIAEHGHQPEFGARPMRRTIQREVDNPLAARLLDGSLQAGGHVRVSAADEELDFRIHQPAEEQQGTDDQR
ncbi:ATP-dependent Clp protease ATP-binding subunit [Actinoalloteichus hymeniacidonis]|uniref:ATPase with chaperone activity, ATP-binding subunit n=1 Tax=Actinoalloteichus hymeniacidonis TaxID=340345 RepID=A0AAC9HR88_9PSEU|nr:ATP-dependent Clp protease ATP-binding subunit [Actinoalloteichus hymeniacidonis]AOS63035.1 ATPase with chaperone activity, ATP-binding subunit [Actinoalloteichus hymeniacidonis]MBB5908930.1 ATP-dependent Clp protease ATP-binding subunit ClpC [Actinoalloteichus hymeniacidonis]